ncbi:MAG TPA: hypothetical protein DCR04_03420 [Flavobacteriales bacterium]|nr:hypothetical protein [Flavobacteriales bacterium]
MKTLIHKLIFFLLYLGVAGLTFFMYNLRWQRHVSPWDIVSLTEMEQRSLANFGDKARSARALQNEIAYTSDVQLMLRKSTERLAPVVLSQLRIASAHCATGFSDLDSLVAGSDPDRLQKFLNHLLALAGPIATKERLNTEVIRVAFFPKFVKTLHNPQDTIPRLILDFIETGMDEDTGFDSIQGVSSFLIHTRACEEGIVSLR